MGWYVDLQRRLGRSARVAKIAAAVLPPLDRIVHRLSGGRWHLLENVMPTLVLTTTGRRSGQPRRQPLAYVPHGRGWAVVGTNFGQDHHPAWTHNLLAEPHAVVEVDGARHAVVGRLAQGDEYTELWERFVTMWPPYTTYLERTERRPRLFVLERAATDG